MLTPEQFNRARNLALRLAGIELGDRHRELLRRRCQRLGMRDAGGLEALLDAAEAGEVEAGRRLIGWVTTGFTGFFRHADHFRIAARHALAAVQQRGGARLWSAAAATGEEPYSLAIALLETFPDEAPPVQVLATDIHEQALQGARRGEYGEAAMQGVGPERRGRFFEVRPGPRWVVAAAVRRLVEFRPVNLAVSPWPVEGPFEVIFCRNVLMYLESGCRQAVLRHMASRLEPGGLLLLDPTEHLGPAERWFAPQTPGVYARLPHADPEPVRAASGGGLRS